MLKPSLVWIAIFIPLISADEEGTSHEFPELLDNFKFRMKLQEGKGDISEVLKLTQYVMENYLKDCNLLVVLHSAFKFEAGVVNFSPETLFRELSFPVVHTQVKKGEQVENSLLEIPGSRCRSYMLFLRDVSLTVKTVGNQTSNKVVVVTASSRWKIEEYLRSSEARGIMNLLVIATTGASDVIIRQGEKPRTERFLNLYTHEIYVDGVGSSTARLITSWRGSSLARNVTLFPPKLTQGLNGRQFAIVASEQPPFVLKKVESLAEDADQTELWDGLEVRLLQLLSPFLNYKMEIKEAEPTTILKGPAEAAAEAVLAGVAEIAVAGVYRSASLTPDLAFSVAHTTDCAVFVTRSSTALPRYRAILGPFHWHVWLALTITYFLAILPLTFAEQHSLMYLWDHPWHIETMFWYVFGTFTNCFTFKGDNSWTKSKKFASRMLIGWYWVFSIIVTACYTGSIIAFITLYVYPPVIDTVDQLLAGNFRVGSLSTGGWGEWFNNSDHPQTKWLLRDIELVPSVSHGLKNVTGSFYLPLRRPYTFLASKAHLLHVLNTNYTLKNRKDVLHVTRDCFVPFSVTFLYPKSAPYRLKIDEFIQRAQQGGLITKILNQMKWELQRSASGQRLQAGTGSSVREALVQDRRLSLDDTQGMFLLLGAGFLIATAALFSELSGHHQARGRTWKLWQWRCNFPFSRILGRLRDIFPGWFSISTLEQQSTPEGFLYKTYDSRVLHSQYQDVQPITFQSESYISYKDSPMIRSTSLPELNNYITNPEQTKIVTCSCHQIRVTSAFDLTSIETSASHKKPIYFGSVGSILPLKYYKEALNYTYLHNRPQTCQI